MLEMTVDVATEAVTMTSLELVEFINSQRDEDEAALAHSDFLKKVPQVLGKDAGKFSSVYMGGNGQERPCYRFPKREACLMAMSYSYDLQAKVFDRMTALEARVTKPAHQIPQSLPEALRLAADLAEQKAEVEQRLALAAPKADALDRFSTFGDGSMCITNAAKALQVPPKAFFRWLRAHGWIYSRAGAKGCLAYQSRIQVGYLEHKVTTVERSDGTEKVVEQVLVTAKGLAKLAQDLETKPIQ